MKKSLIMAAVVVFGFANVNAQESVSTLGYANNQEEGSFGFDEGDIFIEGTVGFGSTNDKNSETKTNNFNISPKAGYFIMENLAVGIDVAYSSYKREVAGTDTNDRSGFGAGVFGRYYFLDLGKRFKTYTELGLGYASDKDKIVDVTNNTFGAGLDLGINYFVTEKIALTFGLKNLLSFSSTKADVTGAKAETNFNLGFGDVANPFGGNAAFGLLFKL